METPSSGKKAPGKTSAISAEFVIGLLAIAIGVYNLLATYGVISWNIAVPQLIGNILLVLAGLFLWLTAYKLGRHKYHSRHMF